MVRKPKLYHHTAGDPKQIHESLGVDSRPLPLTSCGPWAPVKAVWGTGPVEDPYKKICSLFLSWCRAFFYPPMYSTQSSKRSKWVCLSAGEASQTLPLRKANRPSFRWGPRAPDLGWPAPSTNQHCWECLCALTKHKYLFSIEGLQGHGK